MRSFRKNRRPGNRAMSKAESARVDAVKRTGCLCCIARGFIPEDNAPMVDAHHLLSGGIRIGHDATVGLCKWHHSSRLIVEAWSHAHHRRHLGPSLLDDANAFHAEFGADCDLLAAQDALLAGKEAA